MHPPSEPLPEWSPSRATRRSPTLPLTRQMVGRHKTVPTRDVTSLLERPWDSERMDVWGGAMVCRTRLILEQTGLTCCCRSQGLLSLLCKRRCGGGGGLFAWEEHLPRLRGPTSSHTPLHYALTHGPVTEIALKRLATKGNSNLVSYRQAARPRHPHGHLSLQAINIDVNTHFPMVDIGRESGPAGRGRPSNIRACTTTKRASIPP